MKGHGGRQLRKEVKNEVRNRRRSEQFRLRRVNKSTLRRKCKCAEARYVIRGLNLKVNRCEESPR